MYRVKHRRKPLNISVSAEVRAAMMTRTDINWSRIAEAAFQAAIEGKPAPVQRDILRVASK